MKISAFPLLLSLAILNFACSEPTTTVNSNVNTNINTNVNINANTVVNADANFSTTGTTIDTKEPNQCQGTVTLKFETLGEQKIQVPTLQANVARLNDDRRMEFTLPNGEKIVYLDKGGRQFIISPARKQYAELTEQALGFEVRRLMMPSEIINQVKKQRGVQLVGEEQMNGRAVVKYRYGATTDTKSQAGQVDTESFIIVDKETGLPLRSETVSQSQTGNVQGISGVRIVTEMSNIQPTADPSLFAEPTDLQKVEPEQVRQQANALFTAAAAIIAQILKTSAQPTVSPTGSPTAEPNTSPAQ